MSGPPHHEVSGPPDAPLLVLGPSPGTSMRVWEPHLPALNGLFRVVRFDLPGHGGSPTALLPDPAPGGTAVADLADLVLALADAHGRPTFRYAPRRGTCRVAGACWARPA
ncbi:alpha/beta fold hydrolase, partial [Streptomyces milbemycinicus]